MKIEKSWVLPLLVLAAVSFPMGRVRADDETKFQFFITPITPDRTPVAASSLAADGSKISFRGTGTFTPDDPEEVTGEGTWETRDKTGKLTGSGTWQPTRLLKFNLASGAVLDDPRVRAGLAFFHITYSDGAKGILAVSCRLVCPVCQPPSSAALSEGIDASKDFILYGRHVNAAPTFFLDLSERED